MNWTDFASKYATPQTMMTALRVVLTLAVGIPLVIIIKKVISRMVKNRLSRQSEQLVIRAVYYASVLLLFVSVLNILGFKLSALLGAAGILGIAVGFASQTSVSNIISGIFLISEKPFEVGDTIQVGSTIGEIISIDLLSLKLRTPDNRFVRVPNETTIKSEVVNITRFPNRRVDIKLTVAYKEDLAALTALLLQAVAEEPLALPEPAPQVDVVRFGDTGVELILGVWGITEQHSKLKTALHLRIKDKLLHQNIEIPCLQLPRNEAFRVST